MASGPLVSVILPAWHSHATLGACLESLRCQTFRDFEVIVVNSSPEEITGRLVREQFPEVRFHQSPTRLLPHAARNLGVSMACGEILVFSDPDCRMSDEWLARLVEAQREGHAMVGGAVDNLGGGWFTSAVHRSKYPWWLSAGAPGTRPELPSANICCRAKLFRRIGPFPERFCGDTLLSQRARGVGVELWFDPRARIQHDHRTSLCSFLSERFARGCDFGEVRPRLENWNRARTFAYVLAQPLIVLWLLWRTFICTKGAKDTLHFLIELPVLAVGFAARQLGEGMALTKALWRKP